MTFDNFRHRVVVWLSGTLLLVAHVVSAQPQERPYCGDEGVWFQILGSGDLDLDNNRAAASYIVWLDNKARVLIDAGAGTALRFDESHAKFADLHAILLTQNSLEKSGDLINLIAGSYRSEREETLLVFGPEGDEQNLSTTELFKRMTGPDGAYPSLQRLAFHDSSLGHRIRIRDVPAKGRKKWSGYGTQLVQLHSIPVNHGEVPTVAWRIDVGGHALVFANDFNNQKDVVADFAEDADVLVFSHQIPEGVVGEVREKFVSPSQIGRIAARADPRFIVLGSRSWRTFAREQSSMDTIERHFDGIQVFANELECWGL
ncbi:MAG: hypothetical protein OXC80_12380 [Gammaproteobacteria bacterium]|nr:hypothetical protein [Gammaproteobacteria bacterium]